MLLDDVKSNVIQTNVKSITVKLIHFSIAGLIVTSLKLSDLGKREAQNQLTIDKTWANNFLLVKIADFKRLLVYRLSDYCIEKH